MRRALLDDAQRLQLLSLARQSIVAGLHGRERSPCGDFVHDGVLDSPRASFVTLRTAEALRGCCGTLEPSGPLAGNVWRNAWASAFSDPRFPPLREAEYDALNVHVSVLGPLELLPSMHERELLALLRPGVDGLLIASCGSQATFLPAVWEQVREPAEFLRHLKLKAGWSADFWPEDMKVWRYTAESFGE